MVEQGTHNPLVVGSNPTGPMRCFVESFDCAGIKKMCETGSIYKEYVILYLDILGFTEKVLSSEKNITEQQQLGQWFDKIPEFINEYSQCSPWSTQNTLFFRHGSGMLPTAE